MTVTESRLTPPRPVELVPSDEAAAVIDNAHRELADLAERAAHARTTADDTRARAEREGADERASAWAIVRLQRFLDDLREEAEQDARVVVTAARRSASTQLDPMVDSPLPTTPVVPSAAPAPEAAVPEVPVTPVAAPAPAAAPVPVAASPAVPDAPVVPAVQVAPVPVVPVVAAVPVEQAPAPEPVPAMSWAPPVATRPSTNGDVAAHVEAPVIAAVVPAPIAPVAPVSPAQPAPVVPAPVAAQSEPATKRRRFLHGFPLSAALEVLAVLLVLAFILLRLS